MIGGNGYSLLLFHADICMLACPRQPNKQAAAIRQSYKETAIMLYGKYALVKTNLPIILTVSFFGIALFIRVAFDFITSVGVVTIFCILLTISVVYSISLDRTIQNTIRDEIDTVQ